MPKNVVFSGISFMAILSGDHPQRERERCRKESSRSLSRSCPDEFLVLTVKQSAELAATKKVISFSRRKVHCIR